VDIVVQPSRSTGLVGDHALVEVLTSYSHTTHPADLQPCGAARAITGVPSARPSSKPPWSLRDRLDERTRASMINAYRAGATAAFLAAAHGISLRSVKRLVAAAGCLPQRTAGLTTGRPTHPRTRGHVARGRRHVSAFRGTPAGPESGPEGRRNSRRTETPDKVNRC
jgi:hypothetical protein